jgi:hypothetical protein
LEWGLATFLECLTTGNDRSTPESGRRVPPAGISAVGHNRP